MHPQHLALLAETIVQTRERIAQELDGGDLVWTGPETLDVSNRDTSVVVRELFGSAQTEVLVAGSAGYQSRAIFKRLVERMEERPALRVWLLLDVHRHLGNTSLDAELLRRFAQRFRTQAWRGERMPELSSAPACMPSASSWTGRWPS
jgi:hypothetical protein